MKKPEDYLTRGEGRYINSTDYDDAIKAMEQYAHDKMKEALYGASCIHQRPHSNQTTAQYPYKCVLCGEQINPPLTF